MDLKKYLFVFDVLENKNESDFNKYKTFLYSKNIKISIDKNVELEKYINYENCTKNNSLFDTLNKYKNYFITIIFIFSFFLGLFLTKDSIHINLFLIISIVIPFIFILFSFYKLYNYKFPNKKENSLFDKILKYNNLNYSNEHNHVLKTYSFLSFQKFALSYIFGILISLMTVFLFTSVDFTYQSTYDIIPNIESNIINFFSFPWNSFIESPNVLNSFENEKSKWATFILMSIFIWVIIPRILLLFYSKFKLENTMKISLEKKSQLFFEVIYKTVEIEKVKLKDIIKEEIIIKEEEKINTKFSQNYFNILYEMKIDEKDKIIFNTKNNEDISNSEYTDFEFGLFDKEEEDIKTIDKLSNLVIVFTPPESLPDETFKDNINLILKNEKVKQIWILPLIENENENYIIANKGDDKYNEWKYQINEIINNKKVRLYNER